jgi:hypothetical protein
MLFLENLHKFCASLLIKYNSIPQSTKPLAKQVVLYIKDYERAVFYQSTLNSETSSINKHGEKQKETFFPGEFAKTG